MIVSVDEQEVVRSYLAGNTMQIIATVYGVSVDRVRGILRRLNVPRRKKGTTRDMALASFKMFGVDASSCVRYATNAQRHQLRGCGAVVGDGFCDRPITRGSYCEEHAAEFLRENQFAMCDRPARRVPRTPENVAFIIADRWHRQSFVSDADVDESARKAAQICALP